jgi:TFIIF-interacting CTD phosphatase-like protein
MAVFTAAEQGYADKILDHIDPERKYFAQRLYRQHCIERTSDPTQGFTTSSGGQTASKLYIKDLSIIRDRDLDDVLLVDNSILSFGFQLDNGVPICSFFSGNKHQD